MISPTHSNASNTRSRRHHTPLLQERSNSLTRRQEMLKRQSSQSSTSPSASHQQEAYSDAAMPGTTLVCGVRSAFPLIPLSTEAQMTSDSAVHEAMSSASSSSPPRGVPILRRPSSPTAATLFQRQHSASGVNEPCMSSGTNLGGLPPALCLHNRIPRDAPGRPPRVRLHEGEQDQHAGFDAEAGAEEDSLHEEPEEDEEDEAEDTRSTSTDAASPLESASHCSDAGTERLGVVAEAIQPLVVSNSNTSPRASKKRALSRSHAVPARVSVHVITETIMANTPQGHRSIHCDGSSPEGLGDDQTDSAEAHERNSRYLTHEPVEYHTDSDEDLWEPQPTNRPRLRSDHAQHEQAVVSPYVVTATTAHRRCVQATNAEASSMKTNTTSAILAAQLLARTEGRHCSAGTGEETLVKRGEAMPAILQTVGPRVMSASSVDHARQQCTGRVNIDAGAAKVEEAHPALWQTPEQRMMSASEARHRGSQQAVESEAPWYTDADQQPSVLKTVGSYSLSRSSADRSRTNSRRSICASLLEHPSDRLFSAEKLLTARQTLHIRAAEDSADLLRPRRASRRSSDKASSYSPGAPQENCTAGATLPPRVPVDKTAAKRRYSHASWHSSYTSTNDGGEEYDSHPSLAGRTAPKVAATSTALGAGDRRRSKVDEVDPVRWLHLHKVEEEDDKDQINEMNGSKYSGEEQHAAEAEATGGGDADESCMPQDHLQVPARFVGLEQIRPYRPMAHEGSSEDYRDGYPNVHEEVDDSTEYISCYDVACQTSQHLLNTLREECQERPQTWQGAGGEGDVGKTDSPTPHYVGASRWMCAAGVCPKCHPSRQSRNDSSGGVGRRRKPMWPFVPCSSLGYSAPPHLVLWQKHQGLAAATTADRAARLPPLLSSSASSARTHPRRSPASSRQQHAQRASSARQHNNTYTSSRSGSCRHYRRDHYSPIVTSYQGGYCFTREWDAQQQQRHRQLGELQMEHKARRGGTGAAYTPLLLLTSHDMQSRARAAGKEPGKYRYCNLESQEMMVHTGFGRSDLELELYNDTLHGAPLIKEQQDDDDSAVKAIENRKDREASVQTKLRCPAPPAVAAVVAAADSSNRHSRPTPPAADDSAKASRSRVY
nr:unnamed protein product [Leishmania braziliensis]